MLWPPSLVACPGTFLQQFCPHCPVSSVSVQAKRRQMFRKQEGGESVQHPPGLAGPQPRVAVVSLQITLMHWVSKQRAQWSPVLFPCPVPGGDGLGTELYGEHPADASWDSHNFTASAIIPLRLNFDFSLNPLWNYKSSVEGTIYQVIYNSFCAFSHGEEYYKTRHPGVKAAESASGELGAGVQKAGGGAITYLVSW